MPPTLRSHVKQKEQVNISAGSSSADYSDAKMPGSGSDDQHADKPKVTGNDILDAILSMNQAFIRAQDRALEELRQTREQEARNAEERHKELAQLVKTTQQTGLERLTSQPAQNALKLCLPVPTYEGHTHCKSVVDFLQELADYTSAENTSDDDLLKRILPVALTGSAARWRRRQSFTDRADFERRLRAEFLPPDYAVRIMDELRARTQAPDESLLEYVRSFQELHERADPTASDAEKVARAVRQCHLSFQAYLRGRTFSSLDALAGEAVTIQAAIMEELSYKPPHPMEACLEPSCAWMGGHEQTRVTPFPTPQAVDPTAYGPRRVGSVMHACLPYPPVAMQTTDQGISQGPVDRGPGASDQWAYQSNAPASIQAGALTGGVYRHD